MCHISWNICLKSVLWINRDNQNSFQISEKLQTKCVFDERMFASNNDPNDESKFEVDNSNTEDDYFEIMKNMNDKKKV